MSKGKGWHNDRHEHSLASRGVKTRRKEDTRTYLKGIEERRLEKQKSLKEKKTRTPKKEESKKDTYDEVRKKNMDEIRKLKYQSNKMYQEGEISFDEWEDQNFILSHAENNLDNYKSVYEQNSFMKSARDAVKNISRLNHYYMIGAYDKIRN